MPSSSSLFQTIQPLQAAITINSASSCKTCPWNVRLRELADGGFHRQALALFRLMLVHSNPRPDAFSLPSPLRSAAALSLPFTVSNLHSFALKSGHIPGDAFVISSLLSAYARLSLIPLSHALLHEISAPDSPTPIPTLVVCFNSIISGHAFPSNEPLSFFNRMRHSDLPFNSITLLALIPVSPPASISSLHALTVFSGFNFDPAVTNCIITAYAKTGDIDLAGHVFDEMPKPRELISWNALISGCSQNGLGYRVLDLFDEMERSGEADPDPVTIVGVLSSCANLGAHAFGLKVERYIEKIPSFSSNTFLKNALINMHARCGDLARASKIFDGMPDKSLVSWTAIISGFGIHGHGEIALNLFDRMLSEGLRPDGVLMVSVLSACSHSGLTKAGIQYFSNMQSVYGVQPRPEHYACMVDLLGRAGLLKKAVELISSMPMEPDGAVWGSLLSSCKIHKNTEFGEMAFQHVVELEPDNVGYYVLMSNIYLDSGRLDGVARIRAMMKTRGLRKDPGCSYMEHMGKVHLFLADDHSHLQAKSIYDMIARLENLVMEENCGVVKANLDNKFVGKGRNMWKSKIFGTHSEKLAIAFGLLNTEPGREIVVIKNLRVCEDCHLFIKLVSKIANRRFVVRDATRYHHFEGGYCSCKDYW
ncbi:putative pentatricopeptide repeat-containing protein At3g11460, mitochondrial [Dendrobium catenatum]|uniref:Pentatricopeptide repeat-containing protein n=1 Tax=Dendrobium catenatum TaxID=906689 RepID=A0A2I0WG70_9ASPA|nr:putative pentatricopeptide repeat-containing protein At3g11460, mitochondrial [Dendrobium catenatum]PKU74639.1 Putative pentatricopeptide repeat-containing protein [Dendrobium catenatum]